MKRPENAWGDPSRHTSDTLRRFVETLGAERTEEVKTLTEADAWRKKRDEWDAWGAEEEVGASDDPRWGLVRRTREHESFKDWYYALPSHEPGWRRTKYRPVRWCVEKGMNPTLLGIDCEMCETDRDQRALVGVSVVDEGGNVLLKTLVKPPGLIVDLRKEITGLEEKDVLAAKTNLLDVQERLMKLCKPGTVLVGHSLVYDLKALKIDHQPIIDTALLFRYKNLPKSTPSLAVLCEKFLDRKLRQNAAGFHDSVEDAKAALDLAVWESKQAKPTRELEPPPLQVDEKELCKLFIHRIPVRTEIEDLKNIFDEQDREYITSVAGAQLGANASAAPGKSTTSCHVTFTDATRADEAFDRLEGNISIDAIGRAQKYRPLATIFLESKGRAATVVVRKMTASGADIAAAAADRHKRRATAAPEARTKKARAPKPKSIRLPGDR